MARSATDHLRDVLEAITAIEGYTRKGKRGFDRNAMLRDAVAARLIRIAGMRDRLAHKYWQLDTAIVWAVVERDLPRLRAAAEAVLKQQ